MEGACAPHLLVSRVGLLTYVERGKGEERWTCQVDAKNPSLQREGGSMGGRIRGVCHTHLDGKVMHRPGMIPYALNFVFINYLQNGVSTCDLERLKQCWSNTW